MVARTYRGLCDDCGDPVTPGQSYQATVRYCVKGETSTPGLGQGRVAIVLHESCRHISERIAEQAMGSISDEAQQEALAALARLTRLVTGPVPDAEGSEPYAGTDDESRSSPPSSSVTGYPNPQ